MQNTLQRSSSTGIGQSTSIDFLFEDRRPNAGAAQPRPQAKIMQAVPTAQQTLVNGLPARPSRPHLIPLTSPTETPKTRQAPLVVRANRALRTILLASCGLAIFSYGLDVSSSHNVSRLQEQARRLNEQNSELSAQLLRAISFEGIQQSVVGRSGLRVPEQVLIVPEKSSPLVKNFSPAKHHLPLIANGF